MGRGPKVKTGIFLTFTFILYVIHVAFVAFAVQGTEATLFPRSAGNASDILIILITPLSTTFTIWGLIYLLQFIWMIYAFTCLCRNGSATNLLSGKFYLAFCLSIMFITAWFFTWTRLQTVNSLLMHILHQLMIQVAFGFACYDLHQYLQSRSVDDENKVDVWCQRLLVQNSLLFNLSWTICACLVTSAIVLTRKLEAADETASLVALIILATVAIVYFFIENFVLKSYTEYTFTFYLGQIWALSGVLSGVWGKNDALSGLALGLLVVVILLFVLRLVIIVLRSRKRDSHDQVKFNTETQTVVSS